MTAGLAGQSKTDATLIEQSLAEPEQFGVIFERYFGQIHQYLVRRVGTKIADDLAAEVFVAAFAQRQQYDLAGLCPAVAVRDRHQPGRLAFPPGAAPLPGARPARPPPGIT
jgi:hypothetical protein